MEVVVTTKNWSYKTCKASVKISQPTNQHPVFFYRLDVLPVAQPTVSNWRESLSACQQYKEFTQQT